VLCPELLIMAQSQEKEAAAQEIDSELESPQEVAYGELINASGHIQEVDRNFGLLSLTGFGIVNGNVWPALGGTILVAIFNGGPPGTMYEL
jgi:choline transport protein